MILCERLSLSDLHPDREEYVALKRVCSRPSSDTQCATNRAINRQVRFPLRTFSFAALLVFFPEMLLKLNRSLSTGEVRRNRCSYDCLRGGSVKFRRIGVKVMPRIGARYKYFGARGES